MKKPGTLSWKHTIATRDRLLLSATHVTLEHLKYMIL